MVNKINPFGLRPVRLLDSSPYSGQVSSYYVPPTYGSSIFLGDPVILTAAGGNPTAFGGYPPGTLATVALATAGPVAAGNASAAGTLIGSLVSVLPVTQQSAIYAPAGVAGILMVADWPHLIYQIQDNGAATLGVGVVGLNANLIAGAGSTASGQSGWMLDAGTVTAPSTSPLFQLQIIGASNIADNDATLPNAIWDVLINQHFFEGRSRVGV